MRFNREIGRLVIGFLFLFAVVAASAAYWAIIGPDTIAQRQDNPRRVELESQIRRGDIQDRNGNLLVTSVENSDRSYSRQYLYPAMSSALGYASLRYGVSGAEAAYNLILRGDDIERDFASEIGNDLLHHAQTGSDIQLTFDLSIQQEVIDAMSNKRGAVVVLAVPSGQVLAMVSLPTFDPNKLDENWESLIQAPGNPFFNRVLQGTYQPGGVLQTPLIATALLANYSLDEKTEQATQPVRVKNTEFQCLETPTQSTLTLSQAYSFGCPYPFVELIQTLGSSTIETAFDTFQFDTPPTLPGYVIVSDEARTITVMPSLLNSGDYIENALGQGTVTVTPLEMATLAAAIFNDGNSPTPYTLLKIRRPNISSWETMPTTYVATPMMTANSAHLLQDIMRLTVHSGAAESANHSGLEDIGGHVAVAYAGDSTQAWFIGFAGINSGGGVAIAVVVEDSNDTREVAQISGDILSTAIDQLQQALPLSP